MALVSDSKEEFEITEKSLAENVEKAIIHDVPNEFVECFVLKAAGDFCISKALNGSYYLSFLADHPQGTSDQTHPVHLRIATEKTKNRVKTTRTGPTEFSLDGMLFESSSSLGGLISSLVDSFTVEILAGALEKKAELKRLVGVGAARKQNVHAKMEISDKKILAQSYNSMVYTGKMQLANGATRELLFEETRNFEGQEGFLKTFFEQLVRGAGFAGQNLPIRTPIGAILEPKTLIYEPKQLELGFSLDTILKQHDKKLDLTQRVKLCSSAVRIMSELHHSDIYHGALKPENFYADCLGTKDGVKQYELVFNGGSGLLFYEKSDNTMGMVDYDSHAPELAFTRRLSKETGVFSMGRLFETILKPEILKTYNMKPEDEPDVLHAMRYLIQNTTRPNPQHRPTMHGVVMLIREVLMSLPPSHAPINFVHFNQFTN